MGVSTSIDVQTKHLKILRDLLNKYLPNTQVWAFGSRVKWTSRPDSDLDIVVFSTPEQNRQAHDLKDALQESSLPFRVDVLVWEKIPESFRDNIRQQYYVLADGCSDVAGGDMGLDVGKTVDRVSDRAPEGITRQAANNVENVGLRCANPTYAAETTERTLEDCLDALIDYRGKTPEKTNFGIPLITAKIIKNGRIEKPTEFIAADQYDSWMRRGIPKSGDVVLTVEAPLGEVAQLGSEKIALAQRVVTLRGKTSVLDNTYLLYALQTEEMQEQLKSRATGTTVLGIKQSELRKIRLKLPSISTQISAASTLKALDDRITLLRETNATLEAIAQALFKSWFVDFDPVHAKQQGREPEGMDADTAALFPDSFEESELGLVPKGWRITHIREVAEVIKGKSYTSKELVDEHHTALVTLKSFERGGGFRLNGFKPYTGSYKPNQVVKSGDLIVAYTDVTQAAELIGKPAIVVGVSEYQTLVASLDVGIIRPNEKSDKQFLYGLFCTESFQFHTFSHTSGTTVLHLSKDGIGSFQFAYPPIEVIRAFSQIAETISSKRQTNIDQIRILTTLRDTLLPRLISGQLRLPDAEEVAA